MPVDLFAYSAPNRMHIDIQNIIQGHVGRRTVASFGDAWVKAAKREISKLPRYRISKT
jgi:hypothetical protein